MLAEGGRELGEVIDRVARFVLRALSGELSDDPVDVFQLAKGGPSLVLPSPPRPGRDHYGKGLGEVFGRVRLGVPRREVQDVVPAVRLGFVPVGIGQPW